MKPGHRRNRQPRSANDRAWADYAESFRTKTLPFLLSSAFMVKVSETVPDRIDADVIQAATELGLMLLLDKPLLLLVSPGEQPTAALQRAATRIVEDWDPDDPASQERMSAAIQQLKREAGLDA